jgi:hypothetical protein
MGSNTTQTLSGIILPGETSNAYVSIGGEENYHRKDRFLENVIISELLKRKLIGTVEKNESGDETLEPRLRTNVLYLPPKQGVNWRKYGRPILTGLIGPLLFGGLALNYISSGHLGTGIITLAMGFGAYKLETEGYFDQVLSGESNLVAVNLFKNITFPWQDARKEFKLNSKKTIDAYVRMATNPEAVKKEFSSSDDQTTLGILMGAVGDFLDQNIIVNGRKPEDLRLREKLGSHKLLGLPDYFMDDGFLNLSEGLILNMLGHQKLMTKRHTVAMNYLRKQFSLNDLANMLRNDIPSSVQMWAKNNNQLDALVESVGIINEYIGDMRLIYRTDGVQDIGSVCSKMSSGYTVIAESVGQNAFSYLGEFSKRYDFPGGFIKGHAKHSLMTNSIQGMTTIEGNVEHRALDDSTGGILLSEGYIGSELANGANDSTWPLIGISYKGIDTNFKNGHMYNGLIISLNEGKKYDFMVQNSESEHEVKKRPPMAYLYNGGKLKRIRLDQSYPRRHAAELVKEYLDDWVKCHDWNDEITNNETGEMTDRYVKKGGSKIIS